MCLVRGLVSATVSFKVSCKELWVLFREVQLGFGVSPKSSPFFAGIQEPEHPPDYLRLETPYLKKITMVSASGWV